MPGTSPCASRTQQHHSHVLKSHLPPVLHDKLYPLLVRPCSRRGAGHCTRVHSSYLSLLGSSRGRALPALPAARPGLWPCAILLVAARSCSLAGTAAATASPRSDFSRLTANATNSLLIAGWMHGGWAGDMGLWVPRRHQGDFVPGSHGPDSSHTALHPGGRSTHLLAKAPMLCPRKLTW